MLAEAGPIDGSEPEYTIEELQEGKPLMVYRYIDGLMEAKDDNYKFSQAFEIKILSKKKIIAQLNKKWRSKKAPIDIDADRKDKKNQARLEFWSYIETKMGVLSLKDRMSSRNFTNRMKQYEKKNRLLAKKEIKKIQAEQKKKTAKK